MDHLPYDVDLLMQRQGLALWRPAMVLASSWVLIAWAPLWAQYQILWCKLLHTMIFWASSVNLQHISNFGDHVNHDPVITIANPTSSRITWLLCNDAAAATLTKHHEDATYHVHHKLICMCGTPNTNAQCGKPTRPHITHLNHMQPWPNYTTGHPHQNTHYHNLLENLTLLETAWILQSWLHTSICMCYPWCGCPSCEKKLYLKTKWLVTRPIHCTIIICILIVRTWVLRN